jgi:membrane-associated phospholipid phosphatase
MANGRAGLREAILLIAGIVPTIGIATLFGLTKGLDEFLFRKLALTREATPDWLISAAQWLSWIGDDGRRAFFLLIFGGMLAFLRRPRAALVMIIIPVIANITSSLMKSGFARPRPDLLPHLDDFSSASFPSGHATSSAVIFLLAAMLLPYGKPVLRFGIAGLMMLGIGLSRPMLAVHWPSDVLAGWMLGAGFAILGACVVQRMEKR